MLQYVKETQSLTKFLRQYMLSQINDLQPVTLELKGSTTLQLHVTFELEETMLDGKVVNAVHDITYAAMCNICGAKPADMNIPNSCVWEDKKRFKPVSKDRLDFGVHGLHCWVNCFQCICNIGERLTFSLHQARGENKVAKQRKRKEMQLEFKKISINYAYPKPGGGNTNTGKYIIRHTSYSTKINVLEFLFSFFKR